MSTQGQESRWRYYGVAALLWMLLYTLLSALVLSYEVRRIETDFLQSAADVAHTVRQRVEACEAALDGLAFALATRGVPDLAFERYARHVLVVHDQIARIVTIRHVPSARLQDFLRRMRARHGSGYRLHDSAFGAARTRPPVGRRDEYFPITFVVPHGPEADALTGLDLGAVDFLIRPLRLASATGDPVASAPFRLPDGGPGYMLFQPASEDGESAVALTIHAHALLPAGAVNGALRATLRFARKPSEEIVLQPGKAAGPLARLLLPRLRDRERLGNRRQAFVLTTEHQTSWHDLSPAPLVPMLAISLLGLPAALGLAHQRRMWDRAMHDHQRDLAFRATHDPLTGLPNRALFEDRFAHARELAQRGGERFALVFIDLDNFKQLNDRFGHDMGDTVLRDTARRISRALRKGDTVARIGGDEFLVLLEGVDDRAAAQDAAEHIVLALRAPIRGRERLARVDASIGVALFPDDGISYESLSAAADAAMYAEKRSRNAHHTPASG